MLHNPRVSPCTWYHRSIHLCNIIPRYTKYSYPKLETINLHNLIWGDQYQPSISKLPSSRPLNLENFNILLTLFHLNEWATSDHGMLLIHWSSLKPHCNCWSTRSLLLFMDWNPDFVCTSSIRRIIPYHRSISTLISTVRSFHPFNSFHDLKKLTCLGMFIARNALAPLI